MTFRLTDTLAKEEQELEVLIRNLDKFRRKYNIQITSEKTKLGTNNANRSQSETKLRRQKLGTTKSFK